MNFKRKKYGEHMNEIKRVAIFGEDISAAQIAAQFANIGIPVLLFCELQKTAEANLKTIANDSPPVYFHANVARQVVPCHFEDDLALFKEIDWLIDAGELSLEQRLNVYEQVLPNLKPDAIISLSAPFLDFAEFAERLPEFFRERLLSTHFFPPARDSHLLELVPGVDTGPEIIERVVTFAENFLGKGVVYARNSPGLIAHRLSVFTMMNALRLASELQLPLDAVDQITGALFGLGKKGFIRAIDDFGIDKLASFAEQIAAQCPEDEARALFKLPGFIKKMIKNGWLGTASGQGFYKIEDNRPLILDLQSFKYRPLQIYHSESLRMANESFGIRERFHTMLRSDDLPAQFVWELLSDLFIYCANRIPEVTENIVNIDNALKWGAGWQHGPFELWDIAGLENTIARMKSSGKKLPLWVQAMLPSDQKTFYDGQPGQHFFDINRGKLLPVNRPDHVLDLSLYQNPEQILHQNWCASLIDIGDNIACLAFHSILHPEAPALEPGMIDMLEDALTIIPDAGFRGLIITSDAANFSTGHPWEMLLNLCYDRAWDEIDARSQHLQQVLQNLKYAPFPVVCAPFQWTLGSGLELAMAADLVVAHAELRCGFPEVESGLIPCGGGTMRLLNNFIVEETHLGPSLPAERAFDLIGFARISSSAPDACRKGFLRRRDVIVMNREQLLFIAKAEALRLAENYTLPVPTTFALSGESGRVSMEVHLDSLLNKGEISAFDWQVRKNLASVLTGGPTAPADKIDEQTILDLEREAFVRLCKTPETQQRLARKVCDVKEFITLHDKK